MLAIAALTAACAPRLAAEGPDMRIPAIERVEGMGIAADRYVTRDGVRLGLAHWDAPTPFAVIVALHGMSDYSNAFAMPAPWWAEHGITTYAYDQRSFGRSPEPGIWPGNTILRRDLADFVGVVKARHPGLPVYVLGESMGGAVAMTALRPAIRPSGRTHSRRPGGVEPKYHAALLSCRVVGDFAHDPLVGGFGIGPEDHAQRQHPDADRDRARSSVSEEGARRRDLRPGLADGRSLRIARAAEQSADFFLYGGNDQIIPKPPTDGVVAKLGPNASVKRYPQGYHMLLRDLDGGARWADIALWVGAQAKNRTGPAMASR